MLQAISLYTGIGGLDFGFEAAGFRTAVAVEMDRVSCATIKLNRDWAVIPDDIHTVSSSQILKSAGVRPSEADVLIGGPPCQPFSKSGYWKLGDARRLDDPRSDTLVAFLRVLRDAKPRAFLFENVAGLAYKGKDEGLRFLLEGIDEVNNQARTRYTVTWMQLNAAHYGVPQLRERVFLVGSREGREFDWNRVRRNYADSADSDRFRGRTAWDAIGDLPQDLNDEELAVTGYWADLLPSIPEGQNYLWHTPRNAGPGKGLKLFGWRTRYWSFLLKLNKDLPSWTIQAQPGPAIGPFHWKNRKLSAKELCRLQTFPENLKFNCSRMEVQRLLGNAVPSLLAEVLAREIRAQFFGSPDRGKLKLLPPIRKPVPAPEPVRPVPAKYEPHIGEHEDHPGEGKGVGARRRATLERKAGAALAAQANG